MDGLLSFLLFALFFYLMMRVGCGSHMAHGHHGAHGNSDQSKEDVSGVDPVCGKKVDSNEGYSKFEPEGRFFFCSKDCLDQFERDPKRYISSYPMLLKSAAAHSHSDTADHFNEREKVESRHDHHGDQS